MYETLSTGETKPVAKRAGKQSRMSENEQKKAILSDPFSRM